MSCSSLRMQYMLCLFFFSFEMLFVNCYIIKK
nr:MAG TPA: hypothetical protein [Bacteriophage sp.]